MNRGHDINSGALDHASLAPQLMSCNYYVCGSVCLKELIFWLHHWCSLSKKSMIEHHPNQNSKGYQVVNFAVNGSLKSYGIT